MLEIILAGLAVMLVSLIGIVFVSKKLGTWMETRLRYLTTFSMGVFIVIVGNLLFESLEHEGFFEVAILTFIGALTILLITNLIPKAHHHHIETDDHEHSRIDARRMLLGDSFHNIGDGFLIVAAFSVNIHTGIAAAFGIIVHELVQEISEFFVLKQAGYSTKQALARNFIVSGTVWIGIIIGLFLGEENMLAHAIIPFAAGGFLYIIIKDLIPHTAYSIQKYQGKKEHITSLVLGMVLMGLITLIAPHGHGEEDDHGEEEITLITTEQNIA